MKMSKEQRRQAVDMAAGAFFGTLYWLTTLLLWCLNKPLIAVCLAFCFACSVRVRYFVFHLHSIFRSFVVNSINYFIFREWNYPNMIGNIDVYTAHNTDVFGCCKTLSAVKRAKALYKRYNGAFTFDYKCKDPHHVTWKVNVLSNVEIDGIPVTFRSMDQLVALADQDLSNVFTIVLIDEVNAVLNSRNFKTNFQNEEQINAIVTCRHNNIYMMMVGQRFQYLDSLVRSLAGRVIECVHIPLINTVIHFIYRAYDLNNMPNPLMVKRIGIRCQFLHPDDYSCYDTKALVSNIAKSPSLSSSELTAKKGGFQGVEGVRHLSRKGRKLLRK